MHQRLKATFLQTEDVLQLSYFKFRLLFPNVTFQIITGCELTRVTQRVSHVEQDLLILLQHLRSPLDQWRRVAQVLVFFVVLCALLFVCCLFFFIYKLNIENFFFYNQIMEVLSHTPSLFINFATFLNIEKKKPKSFFKM